MRCSIVIPCWNGADLTAHCLRSLLAQVGDHELEILIVDNASDDHTKDLAQMDPRIRVLRQPHNRGFAGGVNAGIAAARLPFVLILNNDTQAAPNLLDELHAALTADARIGAAAPVSNHVKGPAMLPIGEVGREASARAAIAAELACEPPLQDVDTLAGLCLLARRATLQSIGPFDERFGHGNFEDDDYCLRLRLHGLRLVIARRAFLHHEGHATFRALGLEIRDEIERRRAQFVAKWRHDPAGAATIAAMRGDLEAAAAAAERARKLHPAWIDAEWHLARAAMLHNQPGAAESHLRALLQANPRHSDAAAALVTCLTAQRRRDAERTAERTARTCHLDTAQMRRMHERLGQLAYEEGRHAAAACHFEAALLAAPDDGELHNWFGLCHLAAAELERAAAEFVAATELGCRHGWTNLGIVEQRRGNARAALRAFEAAARAAPDDGAAAANLHTMRRALSLA